MVPFSQTKIASQARYSTASINSEFEGLPAFWHKTFKSEEILSIFIIQDSRMASIKAIISNETKLAGFEQRVSDISSHCLFLTEIACFLYFYNPFLSMALQNMS